MVDLPTPPPDIELSNSAARTLTQISQRSTKELLLLKSLYTRNTDTLDCEPSFFLDIPTSQYDPVVKTRTAVFQDTGALLTMPEDLARLVLWRVEGSIHKLPRKDTSEGQRKKVEALTARLAAQHPHHVTNVIRLWQNVINAKEIERQKIVAKDLGLLFQHQHDEVVIMSDRLGVQMELFETVDQMVVIVHDEDESEDYTVAPDEDDEEWETEAE